MRSVRYFAAWFAGLKPPAQYIEVPSDWPLVRRVGFNRLHELRQDFNPPNPVGQKRTLRVYPFLVYGARDANVQITMKAIITRLKVEKRFGLPEVNYHRQRRWL